MIIFEKTEFIKSAVKSEDFIRDRRPQITFAGRSNVGKSSVINSLLRRKNYARVGNQPGKTSQINYFLIDNTFYITDLPGYGYAKVSKEERLRWGKLMESYFAEPRLISAGVLIVDIRLAPSQDDIVMKELFKKRQCPIVVVANKADKIRSSLIKENIENIRDVLELPEDINIIPYSAEKGTGRDKLAGELEKFIRNYRYD